MKAAFPTAAEMLAVAAMLAPSAPPSGPFFEDRTAHSGIGFVLRNAATAERHEIETTAGGVAAFDYDNDGYPDIYFANGAERHRSKNPGRSTATASTATGTTGPLRT